MREKKKWKGAQSQSTVEQKNADENKENCSAAEMLLAELEETDHMDDLEDIDLFQLTNCSLLEKYEKLIKNIDRAREMQALPKK